METHGAHPARPHHGLPAHRSAPWTGQVPAGPTHPTSPHHATHAPGWYEPHPPRPAWEHTSFEAATRPLTWSPTHTSPPGGVDASQPTRQQVVWDRVGAALIVAGVVAGMWVAWVLVGTNLSNKFSQSRAEDRLEAMTPVPAVSAEDPTFLAAAPLAAPTSSGSEAARITIPAIGVDAVVFSGTDPDTLTKGPGIWAPGVMPGMPGNATISGHRTTHGAPFRHLDALKTGDRITVSVPGQPDAVFEVRASTVVPPNGVGVTAQTPGVRLTLTTCNPVGSDAERLVVQAELVEGAHAASAMPASSWSLQR